MCMELRQCWADDNHAVSGGAEHFNPADALRAPLISGVSFIQKESQMQFEEQIDISAPAEKIFAIYSNVEGWSSWDPDVKTSSIEGAFVSGANGTLEPSKGPKAKIAFTKVLPNRSFTVKSKLPLCVMRFEHELSGDSEKTKVVHRVTFDGILSPLFGRIIGSQISNGLPNTLQGLKHAAERKS